MESCLSCIHFVEDQSVCTFHDAEVDPEEACTYWTPDLESHDDGYFVKQVPYADDYKN